MTLEEAVLANYRAFQAELPRLLGRHREKFALLKDGLVTDLFGSEDEALKAGELRYGAGGMFSVQQVIDRTVDLGMFSRVFDFRPN